MIPFLDKLFGKKETADSQIFVNQNNNQQSQSQNKALMTYRPKSFDELKAIIDFLRSGKPAIVDLTEVKVETQQRVIDILSGAAYAMDCDITVLSQDVYVFAPDSHGM